MSYVILKKIAIILIRVSDTWYLTKWQKIMHGFSIARGGGGAE